MSAPARSAAATSDPGVYQPQQDSQLLVDALECVAPLTGRRVADLCTGGGFVAVAAAVLGAGVVTAFDICPRAVRHARVYASVAGARVSNRLGSWMQATESGPFDVVLCNPPYVPIEPESGADAVPAWAGPSAAWNGGPDGRLILDPLCTVVADMLDAGGTALIVQSELSGVDRSLEQLHRSGLRPAISATRRIPFGPVLTAQASWLEESGRLVPGRRDELLVVIRADKP